MAFDQATRNRLQRFVNDSRRVLEEEFTRQLQNDFGLDPNAGSIAHLSSLRHINGAQLETARILRDTLAHYCAGGDMDATQGLDRIVREQAFTVLNRLAALRMAEARGLLVESVGNGFQAKGFQLYARLVGTGLGETGDAYRTYLFSVFDELSQDLPGLFDRYSPQGRLFPREAALLHVLNFINDADIAALWSEDETIGWIYQYFNSKEERKAMRDASQAPRDSRELAVRNQFFTPRYVVELLVDNTLGRLWFNATGGETSLRARCQSLLVKPNETSQRATRLRDPRTIKLLDPACGSMHFGLYAFDLFTEIYREAWTWEQRNGPGSLDVSTQPQLALKSLGQTYHDESAFLRDVPRLIIEHNIYGVDIDPRAVQIASLALWLRAQRSWHDSGVKAGERPRVGRGQVVAAIAPPAERELREQFAGNLDRRDAKLFHETLQLLKVLPELGMLLQIERELPSLIRQIYEGTGTGLFAAQEEENWQQAEARLRSALTEFAQAAESTYQGRLFAQDALQGLRVIDLCREKYDVILMNPPFGVAPDAAFKKLKKEFPSVYTELYAAFVKRGLELLADGGRLGAITSRAFLYIGRLEAFRSEDLERHVDLLVDLGPRVMDDAFVEACAYTVCRSSETESLAAFDARNSETRIEIKDAVRAFASVGTVRAFDVSWSRLSRTPAKKFLYYLSDEIFDLLQSNHVFEPDIGTVRQGMGTFDDYRFVRLLWEISPASIGQNATWEPLAKGGPFARYYGQIHLVVNWENEGAQLCAVNVLRNGQTAQVRQASDYWRQGGCTYSKRSVKGFSARALPKQCIMAGKGPAIISQSEISERYFLGWLNSRLITGLIQLQANASEFNTGILKNLPWISPSSRQLTDVSEMAHQACLSARKLAALDETDPYFFFKPICYAGLTEQLAEFRAERSRLIKSVATLENKITDTIDEIYGVNSNGLIGYESEESNAAEQDEDDADGVHDEAKLDRNYCVFLVSGALGIAFGRWHPQYLLNAGSTPELPDPFADLPFVQPGRWKGERGTQIGTQEVAQQIAKDERLKQINFAVAGVLVDDVTSHCDIEAQVLRVLAIIWGGDSEQSEQAICSELGCDDLRTYLSKDSGFFADHLNAYSKSRRQAPIYWPLGSSSGAYTLWLYYPSLTSQTLYTAVNDFVEPKLKQVGTDVAILRNKGPARTQKDERQFEALQAFELELMEFRDTLLGVAPKYKPNCDDGAQISAAPLWALFHHKPWQKVLRATWSKLENGDYDWSHLAMTYWPDRVREKCKTDKSLAIAHGLEDLYIEPDAKQKKARGKKVGGDE